MKTGCLFAAVAWIGALVAMPLVAPLLFPKADMQAIGKIWIPVSLVFTALPAFFIGLSWAGDKRRRLDPKE